MSEQSTTFSERFEKQMHDLGRDECKHVDLGQLPRQLAAIAGIAITALGIGAASGQSEAKNVPSAATT